MFASNGCKLFCKFCYVREGVLRNCAEMFSLISFSNRKAGEILEIFSSHFCYTKHLKNHNFKLIMSNNKNFKVVKNSVELGVLLFLKWSKILTIWSWCTVAASGYFVWQFWCWPFLQPDRTACIPLLFFP